MNEAGTREQRPSIADGIEHPLDHRYLEYGRAGAVLTMLIVVPPLLLAAVLVAVFVDMPAFARLLVGLGVPAVLGCFSLVLWTWPAKEHRFASWRLDAGGLHARNGVWWRRLVHVPQSRIQHTDVSQGPLERHFGLATLHVFTAGTEHAEVKVHGLSHDTALAIRDHLIVETRHDGI